MKNENALMNYRKLIYFYKNELIVHFKDFNEIFYNGKIIDLNEKKLTLVLKEKVMGILPFLLEQINPDSIREFKEGK